MIEISANFTPQANPDAKKASIQHFLEYSGSAKGIVQEYRLIQRTSRVFNEARKATGLSSSKTLDVKGDAGI